MCTRFKGKLQWPALGGAVLLASLFPPAPITAEEASDRIVVVGSRAAAPRIVGDTSVPVDVLTSEDIARTGLTETGKVLAALVPSFNFSISTISDGSDTVRPATLRGLWPDQALVLINGKRRHASALVHVNGTVGRGTSGTDLNAIPPSAIARIEVLRDGAAAQYGSDAIAGVINVVLKSAVNGGELAAHLGQTYKGDGEQHRVSFNGGFSFGPNDDGFVNLTAERRNRNHTDRGRDDRYRVGEAESDNDYLFVNAGVPLRDGLALYAFGGASARDSRSPGFFRHPIPDPPPASCTDNDPGTDCPASPRNNNNIYPNGFLPFIEPDVDDESLTAGVRGERGDWDWDLSFNYGRNRFDFLITNSLNVTLGDDSPTRADSGGLEFTQTVWNFDAVRAFDWFAGPATFAFGAEYRREDYDIHAGEPASYEDGGEQEFPDFDADAPPGIQVFPGFRPENEVSEDRHSAAGYFDVESHPSDKLRLGAALRYEDYSDFGDNLSGKLTARYDLSDAFALRGAVSSGFRAPSLGQQYFNNVSTQFIAGVPFETGTLRNDDPLLQLVGVDELEEEQSLHFSVGAVGRLFDRVNFSIDAYYIDIADRITLSSQYALDDFPAGHPVRVEMERRKIGRFQFFTNAVDTYTRGVDLVADYPMDFDNGATLKLSAAAHYGQTRAIGGADEPAGLAVVAAAGKSVFDRRERLWLESGQPRQHHTFAADYEHGDYWINVRLSRYGSVLSAESNSAPAQHYEAKWLTDVALSRRFAGGITWTLGAQNLFNVYPERNDPAKVANAHIFPFNRRVSPFGANGGYYYTGLKYEF